MMTFMMNRVMNLLVCWEFDATNQYYYCHYDLGLAAAAKSEDHFPAPPRPPAVGLTMFPQQPGPSPYSLRSFIRLSSSSASCALGGLDDELKLLERRGDASSAYASLLRRCGDSKFLLDGKRVHSHIVENGYGGTTYLGNLLVQMYGKCRSVEDARAAFDKIPQRNAFSWSIMLAAYTQNGHHRDVLNLYQRMEMEGVEPDKVIFTGVLSACSSLGALEDGKRIHERVIAKGNQLDVVMETAIVKMYAQCGNVDDAMQVFQSMQQKDIVSWTAIVSVYVRMGHSRQAIELYHRMVLEGINPDDFIFASVIAACTSLSEGKAIHAHIVSLGLRLDDVLERAIVQMYARIGSLADARNMFEKMQRRDGQTWTSMISAYAQYGHFDECLELYGVMQSAGVKPIGTTFAAVLDACSSLGALAEGRAVHARVIADGYLSDILVQTALVDMYGKCGNLEDARCLFDSMQSRDAVAWNAMIGAYAQQGHPGNALELFSKMDCEGMEPTKVTFASIIAACSTDGCLEKGRMVHSSISSSRYYFDVVVQNALLNMYAKCGNLDCARQVFDKMPTRSLVSWNTMIIAYAQHGHAKMVLELYWRMDLEGVEPNGSSFASIATGCSHAGMLQKGLQCFLTMSSDRSVMPNTQHYLITLDLLARAGRLEEAEELLNCMPFQPDLTAWLTLLSACKIHGDLSRGTRIARQLSELDPRNTAPYVVLFCSSSV